MLLTLLLLPWFCISVELGRTVRGVCQLRGQLRTILEELAFWPVAPLVLSGYPVAILVTPTMVTITEKAMMQSRCLSLVRDHLPSGVQ